MQINEDDIRENNKRVDNDNKVGDKVMLDNHAAYKYKTPFKGPFLITQCWNNGTVVLQCSAKKIRYNLLHIKSYTSETNIEYINPETNY